ncbi:MAG TPA: hypothetical protein VJZ06_02845 [Mobilitalea sp.]|nr:hypothetical protein [Mobilitalea sp.]
MTPFDAFEEFFTVCRRSLDTNVVNSLLHNLPKYYTGSRVLLNNGLTGIIAYIPPQCIWKPIVDTDSGSIDLSREREITIASMA